MIKKTTPLRHLAEVRVSNVDKKSVESEVPVRLCNYTDVYYSDSIRDDRAFMTATATASQVARFRLRVGDSIITKDSETSDDIAVASYVAEEAPDLVCGYHLALLRPRPAKIDARFLTWALRSDFLRNQFAVRATGVTRFGLKHEAILGVDVPLPNLPTQRRVADFLDDHVARIDEIIRLREEQVSNLLDRDEAWLTKEHERLADVYGSVQLRHLVSGIRQGWSPQAEDRLPEPTEWSVLKAGCVNGGIWRPMELKALPTGLAPRAEFTVAEGDLLVNRASGSLDLIGSAAVVREIRERVLLCDKVYRLTVKPSASTDFIAALWRSRQVREFLKLGVSGADGMANSLPNGVIRDVSLPAAPVGEQEEWSREWMARSENGRRVRTEVQLQTALLRERKRSLITAAVTGEFDVSTASGRGVA